MLNVMSAFGQLEREVISERTRDKIHAARRKGMWTGGRPVLGYDVVEKRLVVNEPEAEQVRTIFELYLKLGGLIAVVRELGRRRWRNKSWTTKAGKRVHGGVLGKTSLHSLLTNPLYAGLIRAGDELVQGQHKAIIEREVWDAVQVQLHANGTGRGGPIPGFPGKTGALLQGLAQCARCGSGLSPHSTKSGAKRHRYYVCARAQKAGAAACPGSRVAMGALENAVIDKIRAIGRDPKVLAATIDAEKERRAERREQARFDLKRVVNERVRLEREREALVDQVEHEAAGNLDPEIVGLAGSEADLSAELRTLKREPDPEAIASALAEFDAVWGQLEPGERSRALALLVERVVFDGKSGEVTIAFRDGAPASLQGGGGEHVSRFVVTTRIEGHGKPKPTTRELRARRTPVTSRAARMLALAHHVEALVEEGRLADYAQTARILGITRARISQVIALLVLSPAIQQAVLTGSEAIPERTLRRLVRESSWARQQEIREG